jgi:hypothetical protein
MLPHADLMRRNVRVLWVNASLIYLLKTDESRILANNICPALLRNRGNLASYLEWSLSAHSGHSNRARVCRLSDNNGQRRILAWDGYDVN